MKGFSRKLMVCVPLLNTDELLRVPAAFENGLRQANAGAICSCGVAGISGTCRL